MTDEQHDPHGARLPIKIDSTSNGEFAPIPLDAPAIHANEQAQAAATDNAKATGKSRREFMVSACGVASTLLAFNEAQASFGRDGGFYELPQDAARDLELATDVLGDKEFIFDVQGHYVPPGRHMEKKAGCAAASEVLSRDYLACLGTDAFIKDVFMDSDTDMMVLSFVPSAADKEPLTIQEADATRRIVDEMEGNQRLLIHGRVNPNQPGDEDTMAELAERWGVCAYKCYTQWGPEGEGFYLSDPVGRRFIERAQKLGVRNIAIHKGIPFGKRSYEHSLCNDIGVVAKDYPDMNFLIYHSGWVPGQDEGPYDPDRNEGIDSLIKSLQDNDVPLNSNVYPELGSTWRGVMRNPDSAAHTLGKLLKYAGEDNVLWGTDSIWYGSPQDQIQAFRTFQISPELQEKHGYPAMTPRLRAKIFGLNALKPYGVDLEEAKLRASIESHGDFRRDYQASPNPHFLTYGPKTRREFLELIRAGGGP